MSIVSENYLNRRLAVLIDADNIPRGTLKGIMEEVAIYGTPTIKRIYGDWTSPNISGWKASLLENAVTPVQQYSYTTGKNSTDSAMIIDAMDILYSQRVDGFVIVSSDSDFTRLAVRLREAGMTVIGIGERKTPNPFIVACDKFIYIEVIRQHAAENMPTGEQDEPPASGDKKKLRQKNEKLPKAVEKLIAESVADLSNITDDDGFVFMGELGNLILKKQPDFDCRNFGFKSLSALVKSMDRFEVNFRQTTDPNIKHPYVRDKEA
ncbi:MAG: NYN domain-containing protein [Oscillospiraceae bacterium]